MRSKIQPCKAQHFLELIIPGQWRERSPNRNAVQLATWIGEVKWDMIVGRRFLGRATF